MSAVVRSAGANRVPGGGAGPGSGAGRGTGVDAAGAAAAPDALVALAERFWSFQCEEFPLVAIQAGVALPDAVVFRESAADYARRRDRARQMLVELGAIPEAGLGAQAWATHRLLRRELEGVGEFDRVGAHLRPSVYPLGPEFLAVHFANTASVRDAASADLYLARLGTLPAFLGDLIHNLAVGHDAGFRYPHEVLRHAAATVRGGTVGADVDALPWMSPFRRARNAGVQLGDHAARARLLVERELLPAFAAYADFLEGPLAVGARAGVACADDLNGAEHYGVLLRHFTSSELTPAQIHELGLAEVERLLRDMEAVAADAGYPGDLPGYRRFLTTDPQFVPASGAALRAQIESLSKQIDRRIPGLFGRIPRMTYGVESIPEAIAALLPPAYAQPNPADRTAPGIHWVTSLPERAPTYMHIPLALHEAWPGHLMHLALIQEMEELPAFRRYGALGYSMCLEGWALYCEGLGEPMGLYVTPHQRYGRLDMEIWRALRLVVDTGLHTRGWTREQAIEFMAARQALPRPTIEAEVDRYIGMPAQALAYQIGHLKFRELRRRAEQRLGAAFDVRAFHDELMAAGPVTLPVLERLIESWLERASPA